MEKPKFDKHKLREDKLVTFLKGVILYIREHRSLIKRYLICSGGFIVGCIVVYMIISNARLRRIEEFEEALRAYSNGVYTERKQDLQAAAELLKKFTERYRSGKQYLLARYYLGTCLFKLGKYEQGRQILKDFPKSSPLKPYVLECIAHSYEKTSNYSAALQIYKKIIEDERYSEAPNRAYVLISMGRCFEKLGKFNEAKESYIKCITFYRDSAWFDDAKYFLDTLH